MCDFIHVLIFETVSKCRKSPKLTNIAIVSQNVRYAKWGLPRSCRFKRKHSNWNCHRQHDFDPIPSIRGSKRSISIKPTSHSVAVSENVRYAKWSLPRSCLYVQEGISNWTVISNMIWSNSKLSEDQIDLNQTNLWVPECQIWRSEVRQEVIHSRGKSNRHLQRDWSDLEYLRVDRIKYISSN